MNIPLSLTGRRWVLRHPDPLTTEACVLHLTALRKMHHTENLSDPLLFPEMQKAIERIDTAVSSKETIGIFGDYDADGVTGTAILVRALRRRGVEPVVHLPDRLKEGYGMKESSVRLLQQKGVTLLLTVDTGIASHQEIALASTLGIDTIVTDHHRVQGGRPPAHAVLHPELDNFPNKHLSGAGVALMLVRALEKGQVWDGIDEDIILATLGTIGDVMPLTGENRTLVIHGLKAIDRLSSGPLKDLFSSARVSGSATSGDIAFRVVPRINAAGRMENPMIALEALLHGGPALERLHQLNSDRQSLVQQLQEELASSVDRTHAFLCIGDARITPGIAGLIAGKMTEAHGRPSLAAAFLGENAVASLRSTPEIDVMHCLCDDAVRPLLTTFGGHAQAAGCTFKTSDFSILVQALNAALAKKIPDASVLVPTLFADAHLGDPPTLTFADQLSSLAPFGQGNQEPLFLSVAQKLGNLRSVGSEHAHLQCTVAGVKAVGFRLGSLLSTLSSEKEYDCLYRVSKNTWNGRESVQIVLEDLRLSI